MGPITPQSKIVNRKSKILPRLLSFLAGSWHLVALSILLGALTILASVSLMGTSAWLISMAALHPSLSDCFRDYESGSTKNSNRSRPPA